MPSETSSRTHLAVSNALAQLLLCRSDGSLQSLVSLLHRQGLPVSIVIQTSRGLSSENCNTFSDRPLSFSWTTHSAFRVLAVFALALALRMRTDLQWHRIAVSVLLCSRDLEDVLSRLCPARDPRAVLDEVRFDPSSIPSTVTPVLVSSVTVSDG